MTLNLTLPLNLTRCFRPCASARAWWAGTGARDANLRCNPACKTARVARVARRPCACRPSHKSLLQNSRAIYGMECMAWYGTLKTTLFMKRGARICLVFARYIKLMRILVSSRNADRMVSLVLLRRGPASGPSALSRTVVSSEPVSSLDIRELVCTVCTESARGFAFCGVWVVASVVAWYTVHATVPYHSPPRKG